MASILFQNISRLKPRAKTRIAEVLAGLAHNHKLMSLQRLKNIRDRRQQQNL
jgi:hypothetical protein